MFKDFITSFKLKNTYRVNTIIYSLKQLPLIRKILPNSLYASDGLKLMGNILAIIYEIASIFIGKLLYIFLAIFLMISVYKTPSNDTFIHIFVFLTLAGGVINTYMFNPTKDKYYALIIMNMNALGYTISNYLYALVKIIVGNLPFVIIFGLLTDIPIYISLLLPIFVVCVKVIIANYNLIVYKKTKKISNENNLSKWKWMYVAIMLLIAYGLPFLGIVINESIFLIMFLVILIPACYSLINIINFQEYKKIYKYILTSEAIYTTNDVTTSQIMKETVNKQIDTSGNFISEKHGFAYFHDLFVKRHRKILISAVKKQTIVITIFFLIIIIIVINIKDFALEVNNLLLTYLPYMVFIMYLLNRGTSVTSAMFMNCDHSMLTYRIYRTPKVILGLFKERLKTLILINLLPASVIGIFLPILLFLTGGTENCLNYIILFISAIALSIFFSVHYLVLYYLLQPYNINTEIKSSSYKVVQTITYLVCYYMIQIELPTIGFGVCVSIFCVMYSIISLYLAYRFAPKTFKLRM